MDIVFFRHRLFYHRHVCWSLDQASRTSALVERASDVLLRPLALVGSSLPQVIESVTPCCVPRVIRRRTSPHANRQRLRVFFRVRTIDTIGPMDAVQPLTLLHRHQKWSCYSGNPGSSPCNGRDADRRLVKPPVPAFPMLSVVGPIRFLPESRPLLEEVLMTRKVVLAVLLATGLLALQFGCQGCPSRCSCPQAATAQPEPAIKVGEPNGEQGRVKLCQPQSVLMR
jgi:hypothetical protein